MVRSLGVSGRVNAWVATEDIHLEPGIIGKSVAVIMVEDIFRLLVSILL